MKMEERAIIVMRRDPDRFWNIEEIRRAAGVSAAHRNNLWRKLKEHPEVNHVERFGIKIQGHDEST